MRRLRLLTLLALALLLPAAARAQTTPFLTAQGAVLTYAGQPVVLKGTNFDNINSLGADIGTNNVNDIEFADADYAEAARQGVNHVRLGLSFSWYKNQQAAFWTRMDQQVSYARAHGIFLLFNMFTTPGDCYEGYGNSCGFWGSTSEQQQLQTFWVAMASRYKGEPAVAGYDLLNEPTPPSDCKAWFPIAQRIRNAVYAVAPNQLVFVETCSDPANDLLYNSPPTGAQIVYEVHDYFPMSFTHNFTNPSVGYPGQVNEWFGSCTVTKAVMAGTAQNCVFGSGADAVNYGDIREQYGLNWAAAKNVPIYIGEWGATRRLTGGTQFLTDKADLYRQWGVNHAHYTWKHQTVKTGGFYQWGLYSDTPGQTDDPAGLAAVKISWAGAVRPDFGTGSVTPQPSPQPPADTTATVPPSATPLPPTSASTATLGPPTALPTRTPNATQAARTATAQAKTATLPPATLTPLPPASATPEPATPVPPTPAPDASDPLRLTVANGQITIAGSASGGVLIQTWPELSGGQVIPASCARQLGSIICWAGLPGTLQLPAPAGVRWVTIAQSGQLRTWIAP